MGLLGAKAFVSPISCFFRKQPSFSLQDLLWILKGRFKQLLIREGKGWQGGASRNNSAASGQGPGFSLRNIHNIMFGSSAELKSQRGGPPEPVLGPLNTTEEEWKLVSTLILICGPISYSQTIRPPSILFVVVVFFFLFFLAISWAAAMAYGGSQARGWIRAVAASLRQSHSNSGSEPSLQPTPQLTATPDS